MQANSFGYQNTSALGVVVWSLATWMRVAT